MSCGAFGAHGLKARQPALPQRSIDNWSLASNYLIYNGIALLAISFHPLLARGVFRYKLASRLITGGSALFSGSLFGLVLSDQGSPVRKVLGPVTPIGGALMIGGWAPNSVRVES